MALNRITTANNPKKKQNNEVVKATEKVQKTTYSNKR
jgi:hypothetical protein